MYMYMYIGAIVIVFLTVLTRGSPGNINHFFHVPRQRIYLCTCSYGIGYCSTIYKCVGEFCCLLYV